MVAQNNHSNESDFSNYYDLNLNSSSNEELQDEDLHSCQHEEEEEDLYSYQEKEEEEKEKEEEEPSCHDWGLFSNKYQCSNTCISLKHKPFATSFDQLTIQKKIQNQSRASEGRYIDNKNAVTVASNFLNFTGNRVQILKDSTLQWGKPYNLRNQSDQVLPSTSLPNYISQFTNINVPSRGNSLSSTTTANRPGASTPGGQGVDVKHGSYSRYLDKKKGKILSLSNPSIDDEMPLSWYRNSIFFSDSSQKVTYTKLITSSTINNIPFKFSLININGLTCKDKNSCNFY